MSRKRLWVTLLITVTVAWGSFGATLAAKLTPKLGLDLQGGFAVVLTAPEGADPEVLDKAVEIMRRRIENLGSVQEPEISVQGESRILVQLPGVTDRERALEAVGTTGELSLRPVLANAPISPAFLDGTLPFPVQVEGTTDDGSLQVEGVGPDGSVVVGDVSGSEGPLPVEGVEPDDSVVGDAPVQSEDTTAPSDQTQSEDIPTTTTTTTTAPVIPDNIDPETGLTIVDDPTQSAYLSDEDESLFYHLGPSFLVGADISNAAERFIPQEGWVVDPEFTSDGGTLFETATGGLTLFDPGDPRRSMAIVVDGEVVSAPQVSAELAAGEALDADAVYITVGGGDDQRIEAEDLATILRYGALPTVFERERVESVSASLGSDSLRAGLISGLGGLIFVAVAMLLYYRALGLIAVLGLTIFGSLLVVAISLLGRFQGATLTLAGVTGIIVSIGITSDSYIVFFERIKEEHRRGKPLRAAVDQGFGKAFSTVLKGDTVTFAAAILLWTLAIGPVKGFAVTLGIATVIDVMVAYFYTRPISQLLVRSRLGTRGPFSIRAATGRPREDPAEVAT